MVMNTSLRNLNQQEIDIQHITEHSRYVRLRLNPHAGTLHLRAIDKDGEITHRELITYEEINFDALHDGTAWYLPLVIKALRIMDDRIENPESIDDSADYEVPTFIHRHYMQNGRSRV